MSTPSDIFAGTSGPRDARIAIVGESWGYHEEKAGKPFVGASGEELTRMLADAGIAQNECFLTNVVNARPRENDMQNFFAPQKEAKANGFVPVRGLCPLPIVRAGLQALHAQLEAVAPDVIVAFGNYALWALTQNAFSVSTKKGYKVPAGISSWRGSYLEYDAKLVSPVHGVDRRVPLIPTYHPAAILRQWNWRATAVHDLRRAARVVKDGGVPQEHLRFIKAPTFGQVLETLDMLISLPAGSWLTCDVETYVNHIDCVGFAWSESDAICIPFFSKFSGESYWTPIQERMIRARIQKLFSTPGLRWSNQNFIYDLQHLEAELFSPPDPDWDTMVAHHLCYPGTDKSLDVLASLYCDYYRYWGESSQHTTDAERWHYNCIDTVKTWEITGVTQSVVEKLGLSHLMPERLEVLQVARDMMRRGVLIDVRERKRMVIDLMEAIMANESFLQSLMPAHIPELLRGKTGKAEWWRSPTQQAKFFYELCGIPVIVNPKTKNPTVDDDALPKIKLMQPVLGPLIDALQELRTMGIYYNMLTMALEPRDRLSSSFNTCGTVSFRWSSSENAFGRGGNLQNIAKEKDAA